MSDMPDKECPHCGKLLSTTSRFCDDCGLRVESGQFPVQGIHCGRPSREECDAVQGRREKENSKRATEKSTNRWIKGCGIGCTGLIAIFVVIILVAVVCGGNEALDGESDANGKNLTDSQYDQVADALTELALDRNWCYKRGNGSLDSRDGYILVVTAEDIAGSLFGTNSYDITEVRLVEKLLQRSWSSFLGPDYDRGGEEFRYRPPGCG